MPLYVVQITKGALERVGTSLTGANILILGIAYKRDVDDLRESPALSIIELLQQGGALVHYNDPFFPHVGSGRHYTLEMDSTPLDDIGKYDCVVIVTDHTVYDYERIVKDARLVIDSRNATRAVQGSDTAKIVRC